MYVFDATPLIYLAKAKRLALVDELSVECCTPERVFDEVVTKGIEEGHADARRIERAIDTETIAVLSAPESDLFERLQRNQHLSEADAAVLALADEYDGTAVMDEQYGRTVADSEGVPTRGTAYLVLRLVEADVIGAEEARETIDAMIDAGWYCAPDLYANLRRRIDNLG